jgi:uncharacterized protein YfaS (alpha-2-macroglobulin family)
MANPFSKLRDKVPPRLLTPFRRKWQGKDVAIAVLALLLTSVSAYAFKEPLAAAVARFQAGAQGGETVSVFDVVLDRQNRQYVDFLFDRPLGEGKQGEVLGEAPATVTPVLGGSWTWKDSNALRFEPSGGFPVASEFKFELAPERLIKEGQVFTGETEHVVKTDQFLVENVEAIEEPALEGKAMVFFHGNIKFNYAVDPKVLAPRVKIVDPRSAEPIAVELETGWENDTIAFHTAAIQKEKDERKVELVIAQDLTPTGGNAPLQEEFRQEIPVGSSTRLTVREVVAEPGPRESILRVRFSSPISAAVAEKYLRLEPAVRLRLSAERNELAIAGELKPGETYKLTIGKGLPATDDAVLGEEYTEDVAIPDLEPKIDFQSQGMFLSATGNRTLALEAVNAPKARMTIDRVYLNNLFFLFQYGGFFDTDYGYFGEVHEALGDQLKDISVDIGGAKNQRRIVPLKLDRYIDVKEPGLYRFSVGQPDAYEAAQRWVLLTDLGAVVKRGRGQTLVWVSSLSDLEPVGGVSVTLISNKNQVLGKGETDGSGMLRLSEPKNENRGTPYMLTLEKGNDFSFVLLDSMKVDTTDLDVGGDEPPGEGYRAYLYGERDLYRPGEKVKGMAIVRNGAVETPPAMPAKLIHRDPQGREISTQTLRFDDKGLAAFTLDVPAYSLTGHHTLETVVAEKVIGQYRFQVEEFVPDRIAVSIVPPTGKVGPGQELSYQVQSAYLFGPPAANLPVESRVRLMDAEFAPKGFEAYRFRNDERKLEAREVFASEDQKLDEEGRATFNVTMPADAPVPASLEAVITARVQEQGGRGVAAMQRVQVHPYPYYLGLRRLGETYPEPGKEVELEYVAVSPDGKPAASGALRADLFYDRWNTVLRKTASGSYRYESTRDSVLVDTHPVAGGNSRGTFRFKPREYGSYRAVLTDPDTQASTQVEMDAVGWGYSPWALKNPARLELALDRPEGQDYAPGETAIVEVKAPFAGKLLVTVERDEILYTEVHTLTGNTAKIEVPIRAEFRPNAYITATLVRRAADLEPGSAGRAFGAISLPVDRTANHLRPEITAPAEIRPDTKLEIGVKTVPGAVVTVAAVDEGILQLIAQKTADPFELFYRKLALGVTSYDTFSLLFPEIKGAPAGGGEGDEMSQYVRTEGIRRVEPVAFWSGAVTADADGNAKVSFQVPEFQGALRIMAVAVRGDEMGSAERKTRVRTPLVLTPTFPRVLSFDETLQVPVTVRNDTPKAGAIQVQVAATGPVKVEGAAAQSVEVPVGRERTVYFTVKTGAVAGDARFVVTAAGNGEQSRSTTGVPVRADLPPVTVEKTGAVAGAVLEVPFEGVGQDSAVRQVRVSPLPLVQFAGRLEHLLHYPYGCLEQTTSSAFPLIYLGDLARALAPEVLDPKKGHDDPAVLVQAGVRRIATMQIAGGGFSLWPGGQEVHPWGSLYATHFLVEARRAGHPVEDGLYQRALGWVAGQVKAKSNYGSEDLQRTVYGLYVLARAGRPDVGTMDFLRRKHAGDLRPESRALLAAAYASAGNPRALQDLMAGLGEVEQIARQTGGNFNSAIRNRALLLLALQDAAPNSPRIPALVDRLARDSRELPEWTTQEESFTLLALGQFVQRQKQQPAYSGTVFVGGKKVGTFTNQTATFPGIRGGGPVKIQMNAGYKTGSAFFSVLTKGIPTAAEFKPAKEGLEIERTFHDRDGQAVDVANVRQGDLLVIKTRVRSTVGPIQNVAIVNLLPSGLEVENPRLETTEQLPWITDASSLAYLDLRDDRILLFTDLPADSWQTYYTLVRAVAPGTFRLPPVQAEAMYNPSIRATSERGDITVKLRE